MKILNWQSVGYFQHTYVQKWQVDNVLIFLIILKGVTVNVMEDKFHKTS